MSSYPLSKAKFDVLQSVAVSGDFYKIEYRVIGIYYEYDRDQFRYYIRPVSEMSNMTILYYENELRDFYGREDC